MTMNSLCKINKWGVMETHSKHKHLASISTYTTNIYLFYIL